MNSERNWLLGAVASVILPLSGCNMFTSVSAIDPFDRPPSQTEPEVRDEDSMDSSFAAEKVSDSRIKKDDRTSLPVTESRNILTEADLQ